MTDPASLGFRMPAEWARHARSWMAWPCREETFPASLEAARDGYAAVARAIARFEPLSMVVNPGEEADARARCGSRVDIVVRPHDDSWMRDIGPTFLIDGRGGLGAVDWRFNAWGGNFADHAGDAAMAEGLAELTGARRFQAPIFMEGGAIHTDGEGTLITTDAVVLNPNRNPGLTRAEAEKIFRAFLGIEKTIWLEAPLEYDDTDGHIDNLICFARPGLALALDEPDPADPQHPGLRENIRRLRAETDARGRSFEVVPLVEPRRREMDGHRLAASYINFYICNDAVIVPVFNDPGDQAALDAIAACFPGRQTVAVPGLDIVRGGGCVHCITQQQPEV